MVTGAEVKKRFEKRFKPYDEPFVIHSVDFPTPD